jgi:pyruvate,water dikinase
MAQEKGVPVASDEGSAGSRPAAVTLDDRDALDASLVGAKAAALAAARRAGLPVLPGVVLTTAATQADRGLAALAAWSEVSAGGTRPLVVRSSSTVEDGRQTSMAGLFTSVVGVRALADFTAAVDTVLASANVVPLTGRRGEMAVLVQPQVEAVVGGVAFGLDPVSGRRDRVVVATAAGGPVGLVQGSVDGQQAWLTRRGRLAAGTLPLSRAQRRALARLVRDAGTLFGGPQDVEWAADPAGRLWLLQSRPVTAAGPLADRGRAARRQPVLGPGPVAETFPEPLSRLEADLWLEPLREAVGHALRLAGAASPRRLRSSPVVALVGGRAAADLDLLGAAGDGRARGRGVGRGLRRLLDPRRTGRRLVAAWRVGRLRAALAGLATDVLRRADADLAAVGDLAEMADADLLGLLAGTRRRLVALHGHEVLMGWLVAPGAAATTAAAVALRLLAEARDAGLDDAEAVARHPSLLALTPPRLGPAAPLPATPSAPPPPAQPGDEAAVLREALRLRARWMQELSARAAWELGRRLAARGVLGGPADVGLLGLGELPAAVRAGALPDDLAQRAFAPAAPPLPARFRLGQGGQVVALAVPDGAAEAVGAGGGRASGRVHQGPEPPAEGQVLVVRTLDPGLAPFLPRLAGLVAETGSPLSHLAILARELGVPTVVGAAGALERFPAGTAVLIDGTTGEVVPLGAEQGAA